MYVWSQTLKPPRKTIQYHLFGTIVWHDFSPIQFYIIEYLHVHECHPLKYMHESIYEYLLGIFLDQSGASVRKLRSKLDKSAGES